MVKTTDHQDPLTGIRRVHRPRDVFTPDVSCNAFDSLGFSGLAYLSVSVDHEQVFESHFDGLDLDPHDAFVRGRMPGLVYADWLEERFPDVHPMFLRMLRGTL